MPNLTLYKNRPIVTFIILLVLSVGLMFLNVRFTFLNVRSVFFFLTYPVQFSVSAVGGFFSGLVSGIGRINQLEKELTETRQRLIRYQENLLLSGQIEKENAELRRLLSIRSNVNHTSVYARIVFRDPNLTGDYYLIDKGFLDGLKDDMPVVSYTEEGEIYLVGRTQDVNLKASRVRLVTAGDSYIGVTLRSSGYIGILRGFGSWNQNCVVEYIPNEAGVFVGEEIVTSGESEIFPPGILVGRVVGVGNSNPEDFFKKVFVKPLLKYTKLRDVFVVQWQGARNEEILKKTTGGQ